MSLESESVRLIDALSNFMGYSPGDLLPLLSHEQQVAVEQLGYSNTKRWIIISVTMDRSLGNKLTAINAPLEIIVEMLVMKNNGQLALIELSYQKHHTFNVPAWIGIFDGYDDAILATPHRCWSDTELCAAVINKDGI